MKTHHANYMVLILTIVVIVANSSAEIVMMNEKTLSEIFSTGYMEAESLLVTPMSTTGLNVEVFSQPFTDGLGLYAYLYQIDNIGTGADEAVDGFSILPFHGASAATDMGYLTGTLPPGFLGTLGNTPDLQAIVNFPVEGPDVEFSFISNQLELGEHNKPIYILTDRPPDIVPRRAYGKTKSSSSSKTASGKVISPSPEPATIAILGLGGLFLRRKYGFKAMADRKIS